jgi:alkanesulfonate monooxygenase SsuD/methylene tetrahydromethanopterin reductase-like flavin-dependent oxidoreductase (luciferase family)
VVAGTGYLRSEFLALNVDMSQRNELFDESLEVMRGVWAGDPFTHQGKHFSARGVASLPGPVQRGGPPVLIGGNSALARDRAARNQGWSPLMVSQEVARTSRTPGIGTVAELAAKIKEVRDAAAQRGGGLPERVMPFASAPEASKTFTGRAARVRPSAASVVGTLCKR